MKRIFCSLLTLLMLLSLCACGTPDNAETTPSTDATQPTQPVRKDLQKLLDGRKVPELKSREEMLDILQKEVYGYMPPEPTELTFETEHYVVSTYAAGKAKIREVTVNCRSTANPFPLSSGV